MNLRTDYRKACGPRVAVRIEREDNTRAAPHHEEAGAIGIVKLLKNLENLERARRIERPTLTLARLCSTPELRPHSKFEGGGYG